MEAPGYASWAGSVAAGPERPGLAAGERITYRVRNTRGKGVRVHPCRAEASSLMADAVLVGLLLVFIWAAVLVPPAAGARASREADFLGSIRPGRDPLEGTLGRATDLDAADQPRFRPALTANARRRQVLGGLVVAMGATLVLGLLPTFRLLLVVHLLLVNSSLAYVGLLVHMRDQQAARSRFGPAGLGRARGPRPRLLRLLLLRRGGRGLRGGAGLRRGLRHRRRRVRRRRTTSTSTTTTAVRLRRLRRVRRVRRRVRRRGGLHRRARARPSRLARTSLSRGLRR